jgi:hypothetical protein
VTQREADFSVTQIDRCGDGVFKDSGVYPLLFIGAVGAIVVVSYLWIICPRFGRKDSEKIAYGAGKPVITSQISESLL